MSPAHLEGLATAVYPLILIVIPTLFNGFSTVVFMPYYKAGIMVPHRGNF